MSKLHEWIWLTTLPGLSVKTQRRLLWQFGSPEAVYLAEPAALAQLELTQKERAALGQKDMDTAEKVILDCHRKQIGILTMQDAAYPQRLQCLEDAPLVLYYRGSLLPFDSLPAVAVVGSRKASGYGLTVAKRMGYQLGLCGGTVVSGAARGIDSLALEGALSAGGPVAAVLGNGLDIVYPREARHLYEDVMAHGCLLSEYVPDEPPLGYHFPRRNRLMSGLSLGVLVVEAAEKSGSLITADWALEQGRDVFAVPGNVGLACCAGSNRLLQEGATLVTSGWDILENYQSQFPQQLQRRKGGEGVALAPQDRTHLEESAPEPPKIAEENGKLSENPEKRIDNAPKRNYIDLQQVKASLTEDELCLAELLGETWQQVDEIIDESGLPAARVMASLTLLEVKGVIQRSAGNLFALNFKD